MRISGFGHVLFGVAVAGLAVLDLIYGNFAPIGEPFPASLPWRDVWAYGSGAALLAACAGFLFARTARVSALTIGVFGLIWAVARARTLLREPLVVGSWYGVGEAMGPLLGLWILYESSPRVQTRERALHVARILFGAACVTYGAAHFAYATYTAAMVPAWLPGHMGLVYFTGAAHATAGLCLIVGILPRPAAILEAAMMGLFGMLVWLPVFFQRPAPGWAPSTQIQCSETFLAFLLAASAWIVADSLRGICSGSRRKILVS
jgi:uncharacterized membrane protein YphA (DoxX/SURF4 family)